jgi:fluoroquinolone transport system permease protein
MDKTGKSSLERIGLALKADILFQWKQGFYVIYIVLSFVYLVLLSQLPQAWHAYTLPYIIYSDPSVLGMFFIGGIVLLEKQQGILQSIVVTPLRTGEYIASKILSLALISLMATLLISLSIYRGDVNYLYLILGTLLTSIFFTLVGFLIATKCNSVNAFIFKMIPWMILLVIPCLSLIEFPYNWIFIVFPSVACLRLVLGAYNQIPHLEAWLLIIYMIIINILMIKRVYKIFEERIVYGG